MHFIECQQPKLARNKWRPNHKFVYSRALHNLIRVMNSVRVSAMRWMEYIHVAVSDNSAARKETLHNTNGEQNEKTVIDLKPHKILPFFLPQDKEPV